MEEYKFPCMQMQSAAGRSSIEGVAKYGGVDCSEVATYLMADACGDFYFEIVLMLHDQGACSLDLGVSHAILISLMHKSTHFFLILSRVAEGVSNFAREGVHSVDPCAVDLAYPGVPV